MGKKISLLANLLIIVVALGIGVQLLRGRLIASGNSAGPTPAYLEGKQFPVNESWNPRKKTVVLALQVGCHYCTASAPFYARLTKFAAERGIDVIAMMPNPQSDSKAYLNGLNLQIQNIQQVKFEDIKVSGTPTLFVVNDKGVVEKTWQGQLRVDEERRILALLS